MSVVLDIPTRALPTAFRQSLANDVQIGSTGPSSFGNRAAAGYIVDTASRPSWATCRATTPLDPARIKPIEAILSKPLFTAEAARIARWMSREYVATLSGVPAPCPRAAARVVKGDDGVWTVERPAVKPIQNRWVMLTPEGLRLYASQNGGPPASAHRGAPVRTGHDARPQSSL